MRPLLRTILPLLAVLLLLSSMLQGASGQTPVNVQVDLTIAEVMSTYCRPSACIDASRFEQLNEGGIPSGPKIVHFKPGISAQAFDIPDFIKVDYHPGVRDKFGQHAFSTVEATFRKYAAATPTPTWTPLPTPNPSKAKCPANATQAASWLSNDQGRWIDQGTPAWLGYRVWNFQSATPTDLLYQGYGSFDYLGQSYKRSLSQVKEATFNCELHRTTLAIVDQKTSPAAATPTPALNLARCPIHEADALTLLANNQGVWTNSGTLSGYQKWTVHSDQPIKLKYHGYGSWDYLGGNYRQELWDAHDATFNCQ